MSSIGGLIGASPFVDSSASIAVAGQAIVVSYVIAAILVLLVMRMAGEMTILLPEVRSFIDFVRSGFGYCAEFVSGVPLHRGLTRGN